MTNLISLAFKKSKLEKRPALLTYTVAGDNTKQNRHIYETFISYGLIRNDI